MLHLKHCKKFEKKGLFLSFCNSACISEVDYIKLHLNWFMYLLASFLHMKFRGVVVIRSDFHTEGPQFDPWWNLFYFFSVLASFLS